MALFWNSEDMLCISIPLPSTSLSLSFLVSISLSPCASLCLFTYMPRFFSVTNFFFNPSTEILVLIIMLFPFRILNCYFFQICLDILVTAVLFACISFYFKCFKSLHTAPIVYIFTISLNVLESLNQFFYCFYQLRPKVFSSFLC